MKLFVLLHGRSKKKMKAIMVDEYHKCENYKDSREKSGVAGWHKIEAAGLEATVWRQKTCTVGGNKCESVGRVGKGRAGYIGKNGFNEHT